MALQCHLLVLGLSAGADTDGQRMHVIFGTGGQVSAPGSRLGSFTGNSPLTV